jgi:hypothetical protein
MTAPKNSAAGKKPLLTPEEIERRKRMERENARRAFKPNLKTIPWKK